SLAAEGAGVVLSGRSQDKLAAAAREIGGEVHTETVDHSDPASVDALVARLKDQAIDILVLNGGGPPPGAVATVATDIWNRQFAAMVSGPLAIAGALLPGMRARGF